MKGILFTLLAFTFSSCLVLGVKSDPVTLNQEEPMDSEAVVDEIETSDADTIAPYAGYHTEARIGEFMESDHVVIDTAIVFGNSLFLNIKHSGGCKDHDYEFIGSPAIMKSNPPKRSVMLVHHNRGDECEMWISKTIEVDLTELSITETKGSEITLLLQNYDYPITYIYQ